MNARSLQLEFAKVMNEEFLAPVLLYGSETILWREKNIKKMD